MDNPAISGAHPFGTGLSPTAEPVPVSSAVAASIPCAAFDPARLSQKAKDALAGQWPRWSYSLHSSHIRFFNRHQLIEQHSAADYRLTMRGQEARKAVMLERAWWFQPSAIATEARRAETAQTGSVHDGAAPQEIAR